MADFLGIKTRSGAIVQPPGDPVLQSFDFSFNSPGLTTGLTVHNPTPGVVLLDSWVEIDVAFDGTTPKIDISDFISGNTGWFGTNNFPIDATVADGTYPGSTVLKCSPTGAGNASSLVAAGITGGTNRAVPGIFVNTNPIKLVCTQDGQKGGAATGATQGSGKVYFLTTTAA